MDDDLRIEQEAWKRRLKQAVDAENLAALDANRSNPRHIMTDNHQVMLHSIEALGPIRFFGSEKERNGYYIFHIFTISGRMYSVTHYPDKLGAYDDELEKARQATIDAKRNLLKKLEAE